MSKRDSKVLLLDMLEAAEKISKYVAGMSYEQFILDDKTCDAVVRNFEIIGEAPEHLIFNSTLILYL